MYDILRVYWHQCTKQRQIEQCYPFVQKKSHTVQPPKGGASRQEATHLEPILPSRPGPPTLNRRAPYGLISALLLLGGSITLTLSRAVAAAVFTLEAEIGRAEVASAFSALCIATAPSQSSFDMAQAPGQGLLAIFVAPLWFRCWSQGHIQTFSCLTQAFQCLLKPGIVTKPQRGKLGPLYSSYGGILLYDIFLSISCALCWLVELRVSDLRAPLCPCSSKAKPHEGPQLVANPDPNLIKFKFPLFF